MAFYRFKILGRPAKKRSRGGLDGLEGAVKICARYEIGKSGKKRCAQWAAGPGYAEGPYPRNDYFIPYVRNQAGIKRKYRYRRSLPYPPLEDKMSGKTQARYIELPDETRSGIVRIVKLEVQPRRFPSEEPLTPIEP